MTNKCQVRTGCGSESVIIILVEIKKMLTEVKVFANLGLSKVGSSRFDPKRMQADLDHLDTFYIGDGWSRDGPEGVIQLELLCIFLCHSVCATDLFQNRPS